MARVLLKDITKVYQGGFEAVHKVNFSNVFQQYSSHLDTPSSC